MTKIKTLLEFVGGSAKTSSDESGGTLESPFSSDIDQMREYLPILYDNLTIVSEPMVGRINLNQAPRAVLEMFSTQFDDSDAAMEAIYNAYGIDPSTLELASSVSSLADSASGSSDGSSSEGDSSESDSESGASSGELPVAGSLLEMLGIPADEVEPLIKGILEIRIADPIEAAESEPDMLYPYWPYTLGVTENLDVIKKLEPYFCTRGSVYRAQVVGRFDAKSPAVRFEVWFDATIRPAKIIRIRELSELGPGYPPYTLGIDDTEYQ